MSVATGERGAAKTLKTTSRATINQERRGNTWDVLIIR